MKKLVFRIPDNDWKALESSAAILGHGDVRGFLASAIQQRIHAAKRFAMVRDNVAEMESDAEVLTYLSRLEFEEDDA